MRVSERQGCQGLFSFQQRRASEALVHSSIVFPQPAMEVISEVIDVITLAADAGVVTLVADSDAPPIKHLGKIRGVHRTAIIPFAPRTLIQGIEIRENFPGRKPLHLLFLKEITDIRQEIDAVKQIIAKDAIQSRNEP